MLGSVHQFDPSTLGDLMTGFPFRRRRARPNPKREHRFAQRHLQSVLDEMLDDDVTRRVLRHVADCEDCSRDVRIWTELRRAIGRLGMGLDPEALQRLRGLVANLDEGTAPT